MKKLLLVVPVLAAILVIPMSVLLVLVGTGNTAAACESAAANPQTSATVSQNVAVTGLAVQPPTPSAAAPRTLPPSIDPHVCEPMATVVLPAGAMAKRALTWALAHVGDAYVASAHGPHAWDCSTFTYNAYRQAGLDWPMQISYQQYLDRRHIQLVPLAQAQPGDLLFFDTNSGNSWFNPVTHVAMIIDPAVGTMVHAANHDSGVIVSNYKTSTYYRIHPPVTAPDPHGRPSAGGPQVAGRVSP